MDLWVPLVLGLFKLGVLVTAIVFSIKSHREGEREAKRKKELEEQLATTEGTTDALAPESKVNG